MNEDEYRNSLNEDELDRLLLELLDSPNPLSEIEARGIEAESRTCRELGTYVEAFAALAWGVPPLEPAPETRQRVLQAVEAHAATSAATVADAGAPHDTEGPTSRRGATTRGWLLPLAATLAVAVLGLASLSGWLWNRVERQRGEIASLRAQAQELVAARSRLADAVEARNSLEDRLGLVASRGVEICPLRPSGDHPLAREARGVLFIGADHQHWYLSLEGLDPAPQGRVYQLWFITPDGPVSGGTFTNEQGRREELYSSQMPDGTNAVAVTLEPEGGMEQPTGPRLLWGDEAMVVS